MHGTRFFFSFLKRVIYHFSPLFFPLIFGRNRKKEIAYARARTAERVFLTEGKPLSQSVDVLMLGAEKVNLVHTMQKLCKNKFP